MRSAIAAACFALGLVAGTTLGAPAVPLGSVAVQDVLAATCNPAHQPSLGAGGVSPTSGTTSTSFTYSVTYRDTKGCPPTDVTLHVQSGGSWANHAMSGTGTAFEVGVVHRRSLALTAGSHAYYFTSTTDPDAKTARYPASGTLSVTVAAPTPVPTPVPTPTATPTAGATAPPVPSTGPTPTPTGTAGASPTPGGAATPPAASTPAPISFPSGSPTPSGEPASSSSPGAEVSPGASPSSSAITGALPGETPGPGGSPGSPGGPGAVGGSSGGDPAGAVLPIVIGGSGLAALAIGAWYLLVARRRRSAEEEAPAVAVGAAMGTASAADDLPASAGAFIPTWLRRSMEEGERIGRPDARLALHFADPPELGVDRRLVRYRLVRLVDVPDEANGEQITWLDVGDEVEVVDGHGRFFRVRTPNGFEGWLHGSALSGPGGRR